MSLGGSCQSSGELIEIPFYYWTPRESICSWIDLFKYTLIQIEIAAF